MRTKEYPTEVVLSVSSGCLLCDFGDMQELAEYLCGSPVFTHQLGHAPFVDELKAACLEQHPQLGNPEVELAIAEFRETVKLITETSRDPRRALIEDLLAGWKIAKLYPILGETLTMAPMPPHDRYTEVQAFTEPLKGKEVIAVEVNHEG
jgi:hypothetical protein